MRRGDIKQLKRGKSVEALNIRGKQVRKDEDGSFGCLRSVYFGRPWNCASRKVKLAEGARRRNMEWQEDVAFIAHMVALVILCI